jgi:hypothetical protein
MSYDFFDSIFITFNILPLCLVQAWIALLHIIGAFLLLLSSTNAQQSDWVKIGSDGLLSYKQTSAGDQIMDFSTAGYMAGEEPIPTDMEVFTTISPSGGDDTRNIQVFTYFVYPGIVSFSNSFKLLTHTGCHRQCV